MILDKVILELEHHISSFNKENLKVSKRAVDWHLNHTIKIINAVSSTLIESNPKDYKKSFNLNRFVFLGIGKIPRGKARSPKPFNAEHIDKAEVVKEIELAKNNVEQLSKLHKNKHFKHPVFGVLNMKPSIRFLEVHSNHHLKIIEEIIS